MPETAGNMLAQAAMQQQLHSIDRLINMCAALGSSWDRGDNSSFH